ncbi:hypothetical protein Ais01nite_68670 [Asanoa ishikariensis]|uniref:Uncharacterized protein n=1 Tax=Asanoa ishikariensis TaxID=137265 RepID=A0A1H3N6P3_9ACTN|nr:hypothetical protein [Asanoa ishikariensis]GIF68832.1 hypothetical protein Ais01nite_68670 [Asanoa ishikariensis]SDY84413.1 hypothetical protein SAMN05421684_1864 [Asanoa ishikariensis]
MGTEPTLPLPGAGEPGQFPPPTDPWSTPDLGPMPDPTSDPGPVYAPPPQPVSGPPQPTSGPPVSPPGPPPGPFPPGGDATVVAQIGEIQVTSKLVHTPAGSFPLAGSTWQVNDFWHTEQKTPTWAVLTAIFGFCVLTVFSLLFLLVKETVHRGTVQVTVSNGRHQYVARNAVTNQEQVQYLHQQVNYVRALAAL